MDLQPLTVKNMLVHKSSKRASLLFAKSWNDDEKDIAEIACIRPAS